MIFVTSKKRAFSLLEVVITVGILSTAIVFILRAFTTVLSATKFSQNITLACLLAEDKLWGIEAQQKQKIEPLDSASGIEKIHIQDFNWNYQTTKLANSDLIELKFTVSWKEKVREEYSMDFLTYLLPHEQ